MFAGGFERIWADDFVCMSVCVCVYPEACVWLSWCLEMFWWEAQGSLARPQDSTVPINQPSSLQLYWPYLETERERRMGMVVVAWVGTQQDRVGWKAHQRKAWEGERGRKRMNRELTLQPASISANACLLIIIQLWSLCTHTFICAFLLFKWGGTILERKKIQQVCLGMGELKVFTWQD